ncbi:fructose-bisphosphate aldolase, class II domain protein [Vibrio cholerae HC-48B2]|nr:fructose-bisphosphate aldolase, class II domain protein [Vibrio cholerae HC-48B2]KKP13235.1 fructose-bisphosphate aldolase, class II domain protein [Vibrio cholerae]KKP20805.1 fructose-bisphosphate aldolase, class II domain protein [Vibrio cholerae]
MLLLLERRLQSQYLHSLLLEVQSHFVSLLQKLSVRHHQR